MRYFLPKVAIARGPGLSKWEMQIYEPLMQWYDLVGIGAATKVNDVSGIKFPVVSLPTVPGYISALPKFIPTMFSLFGDTQWLNRFDATVNGIDLIHSVETHNGFSLQAVRAKQKGIVKRVTLTVYENIPYLFHQYAKRRELKQEVYAYTDHFLAVNEMSREMLLLEGVPKQKISLVPQSVDTTIFHPIGHTLKEQERKNKLKTRLGLLPHKFLVLCVGRMVWEKGWYDIIPAAARLKKLGNKKISFLCVGGGPEKKRLEKLTSDLNLTDIMQFYGLRSYQEMAEVFRAADIFLYPSLPTPIWNAQFGGVLIEAMASGLPIVGTLSGGTRDDTVGRKGGLFVQPQHFSGLSEAILTFYRNPSIAKKMGTHNRNYALTHYSVGKVANKIRDIWDRVLQEN